MTTQKPRSDMKVTSMAPGPLDLRDYLFILRARKWTIIAVAITATSAALIHASQQTPVYTSLAEVIVVPASFDPFVASESAAFTPLNMTTELQVAKSRRVAARASAYLRSQDVPPGILSVSQVEDAETLEFTALSPDPGAAQATAQAYANAYLALRRSDVVRELEGVRGPYETQIQAIDKELERIALTRETAESGERELLDARYSVLLSERVSLVTKLNDLVAPENVQVGRVLRWAKLPRSPSAPATARDGLLGLVIGLALGIALAFLRDRLDDRVRGREELELIAGAPVLAFVPFAYSKNEPIVRSRPTSEAAEAYKALRVRLLHGLDPDAVRNILVTSSLAGEGKTSVTANLGVMLALGGYGVVLVSADLRRPLLQNYFDQAGFRGSGGEGAIDVLRGVRNTLDVLTSTDTENLWILPAGEPGGSSGSLDPFSSEAMVDLLAELGDYADFVLIDTPPLLSSSDVAALGALTDGVLLVVDPRMAQRSVLEQARHELEIVDVPVIGVVVNRYDPIRFQAYGYGYRYYGDRQEQGGEASSKALRPVAIDSDQQTVVSPIDRDAGGISSP